jgi:hypothetical protein
MMASFDLSGVHMAHWTEPREVVALNVGHVGGRNACAKFMDELGGATVGLGFKTK